MHDEFEVRGPDELEEEEDDSGSVPGVFSDDDELDDDGDEVDEISPSADWEKEEGDF